MHVMHHSQSLK